MAIPSPANGDDVADEEVKPLRLLDLPPEIWSKIGKMVIDDIPAVKMATFRQFPCKDHQAPILRTCRVIRNELRPYFWEAGVKVTCFYPLDLGYLKELMECVGEEDRRAMCSVQMVQFEYSMAIRVEDQLRLLHRRLGDIKFELTDWKCTPAERVGLGKSMWANVGYRHVWTVKFR